MSMLRVRAWGRSVRGRPRRPWGANLMRRSISIFLAILLTMSAVASVEALTVRRTWTARFGTNT